MAAETRPAGGRGERRAGIQEHLDEALLESLAVDELRRGRDLEAHPGCHLLPPQEVCGTSKILGSRIRAGAEERAIDLRPSDVLDGLQICRVRRARALRARSMSGTSGRRHCRAAVPVAASPAANAPTAPTMFVWLSLPITRSQGWA